jgi:hypothetical protein
MPFISSSIVLFQKPILNEDYVVNNELTKFKWTKVDN